MGKTDITTRCVRCGKTLERDRYGFLQFICEDCLSPLERKLRKKHKEMFDPAHENAHGDLKASENTDMARSS